MKAQTTRRSHAARFRRRGLNITAADLERRYGWDLERMARDLEVAYSGRCSHCDVSYADMPNGIQDLTLDVIDRAAAPVYGANTRFLCQTGNRQKGTATVAKLADIEMAYCIRRRDLPAAPRLFALPEPQPLPFRSTQAPPCSDPPQRESLF